MTFWHKFRKCLAADQLCPRELLVLPWDSRTDVGSRARKISPAPNASYQCGAKIDISDEFNVYPLQNISPNVLLPNYTVPQTRSSILPQQTPQSSSPCHNQRSRPVISDRRLTNVPRSALLYNRAIRLQCGTQSRNHILRIAIIKSRHRINSWLLAVFK
jgi:hypothetical protein